jgi:hypothetical protein
MHQWVAVICQASIQHIHCSVPLLPHCSPDRSTLRNGMNVPTSADSDSDIYDDVGSGTQFNGDSEDTYQQSEEEEFYQDIPDVYQKKLVLESTPDFEVKPSEECPPLPPRRGNLSVSQVNLSDQDSVYDDIFVSNRHSEYSDAEHTSVEGSQTLVEPSGDVDIDGRHLWVQQDTSTGNKKAQSQLLVKYEVKNDDNGEEEIYDDVGVPEKLPKAVKLPVLHQKLYVGNGGGIQNLIRELETCSSIGVIPICGHHPNPKPSNQFQYNTSTTYKSVNNHEKETASPLPQTPAAYHNSKYNQIETNKTTVLKHMKGTQEEAKIFSHRTPIATQRPEIPPRSYLK